MPASFLFALAAATAAVPAADLPALEKDPTAMSPSEIRAFNAGRSAKDPDFIRCRRNEETGSLVRKTFICHTVSQWAEQEQQGNQTGRDVYDEFVSKAGRTSS
ncbi:hypothetical protein [Novosphingobium sp. PASSN1]|uniref:hypothetical protein n=1 Tax=Novosphingobium sp. PASSN1 TaxID=2015561 RepID=UPI000BD6613E|nr:hypothetical protein [Novosphingobium sp. PASSN1]OYU36524.1 MAG: hypothetical protein CFE35_04405 [Novosphingobium sp. PASSN1]